MDAEPEPEFPPPIPEVHVAEENPVHRVLQICGIANNANRLTFLNIEGLDTIEAFGSMSGDTDVTEMAKRMAARSSVATGRVILGTMQINKRLQALVYWVKDNTNRGIEIDPDRWTVEEMARAMDRKESEYNYGKIDVDLIDPGKCQTDFAWDNWQIAFVNKLSATIGAAKFPIDYVVRPEIDDDYKPLNDDEQRRYQIPLTGELNKRVERAKEEISRLHYKDEKVFPFERYITKLKENFYILSKDKSEALTGKQQQVDCLMRGIRSSDTSITSAKINIFQSYRSDFDGAVNFMSGLVANLHASAQLDYANRNSAGNKRRYVSATDSTGGRGRARTGGRSGQRVVGIMAVVVTIVEADVDVVDGGRGNRGDNRSGNNTSTNRATSSVSTTNNNNESNDNATTGGGNSVVSEITERGSQNGRSFGRGAYNNSNSNST
ncbi:hypothetical protein MHU86_9792 [Fragilaria crotonensis]|nr:hypothetical protein MHU86_17112 [Fragilaria crotonensis]KAI2504682.1 hypothetical protein MHU86_9792 [Fragilaria crotonensis]